jgi:hypothetical protein
MMFTIVKTASHPPARRSVAARFESSLRGRRGVGALARRVGTRRGGEGVRNVVATARDVRDAAPEVEAAVGVRPGAAAIGWAVLVEGAHGCPAVVFPPAAAPSAAAAASATAAAAAAPTSAAAPAARIPAAAVDVGPTGTAAAFTSLVARRTRGRSVVAEIRRQVGRVAAAVVAHVPGRLTGDSPCAPCESEHRESEGGSKAGSQFRRHGRDELQWLDRAPLGRSSWTNPGESARK